MFTKGGKAKKVYWKCSGDPFAVYMVGRVLVNVDASFLKNQFYNAGEVGNGTEEVSLKTTPPSYWDPAWNMHVIRHGDDEVSLLVPEKEVIDVGGIPEFDVEPFNLIVIKLVRHPEYVFSEEAGEAGYVQLSRRAFDEEETLWERQKVATAAKTAAKAARAAAAKARGLRVES